MEADEEENIYRDNPIEDMIAAYDYHINTRDLPDLFVEESVNDFIANLNDWD